MPVFRCERCAHAVFFENSRCLRCGAELGFEPATGTLRVLHEQDAAFSRCQDALATGCNWLVPRAAPGRCVSCRLTRTRPNDADAAGVEAWASAEWAKRRTVQGLMALGLPVVPQSEDPRGVAFDLLWKTDGSVTTGHEDGVITLDLTESNDAWRERIRVQLDEPYRTLLGHVRHEIGHYYQGLLVTDTIGSGFRDLFGDEFVDYAAALERHYAQGPPAGWEEFYVSAYASMHPFEDWAETWAHYLHMRDVLAAAAGFGIGMQGPAGAPPGPTLDAWPRDALASGRFEALLDAWVALTLALNSVSRAMGKRDFYPFVIAPRVRQKLAFVHECIQAGVGWFAEEPS